MVLLLTACSSGGSDTTRYNLTINIEPNGSGEVTPDSGSYAQNEELELKATPNLGWGFKEWQGGLKSTRNPHSNFIMDSDYNITAVFEITHPLVGQVELSNKTVDNLISPTKNNKSKVDMQSFNKSNNIVNSIPQFEDSQYKKKEIIIKYRPNVKSDKIKRFEKKEELERVKDLLIGNEKFIHYRLTGEKNIQKVKNVYQRLSIIEGIQLNHIMRVSKIPNDDYYESQWGAINLNLEAAWDQTTGSKEITIAVVDSGIIPNHPDLEVNISNDGYDFVEDDSTPHDLTVIENTEDDTKTYYCNGHGTHVAGILGAVGNNGQGITGVNWNTNILPIRVVDGQGKVYNSDVADGIRYAVDHGANIINLSLGGYYVDSIQEGTIDVVKSAIDYAVNNNVLVFAAAGNDGIDEVMDPASYENTIAVGAIGQDDSLTDFSNYGSNLDLVAPGNNIISTYGNYNTDTKEFIHDSNFSLSGTSMATPYVSGIAGLLLSEGVSSNEVESILKETAVDLGPTGVDDEYGYGLVDAYGSLLWGTKGIKSGSIKVFAATKNDNKLIVQSRVQKVTDSENYRFQQVNKEKVYIVGWRDVNDNGQVDQGDYYGQIGLLIFDSNIIQRNDLKLNYIGETISKVYLGSQKIDLPLKVDGIY